MKKLPHCKCSLLFVTAAVVLSPTLARANDYHVASAQDLQTALTLAAASSVSNNIYITNGYYTGNFNYNSTTGNYLTIMAEPGVTNTQITIDGGGTGTSMNIIGTVTSNITVQGLTFMRNGATGLQIAGPINCEIMVNSCLFLCPTNSCGTGLGISSGQDAIVTNCTATGNQSQNGGTGIYISGVTGNVTVQNCMINSNKLYGSFTSGGGLVVSANGFIAVVNSLFSDNSVNGYAIAGGGAYCFNASSITLSGNTFISNSAYSTGGGATCNGSSVTASSVTLAGNNFTGNSDGGGGGGAECSGTIVTLTGNSFTGNSDTGHGGGGAYCSGTALTLSGNSFSGNSSTNYDPYWGIEGSGGGAFCFGSTTILSNNTVTSNSALLGGGAYLSFQNNTSVTNPMTISANTFQQNTAAYGGGLFATGPVINLLDNLVVGNGVNNNTAAATGPGGGIWVDASGTLNMINNTLTGNTSPGSGGGVAYVMTAGVELLNIYNNIIFGNSAPVSGADVWVSGTGQQTLFDNNDVDSPSSIYGVFSLAQNNIYLSPNFFDPVNGDYHTQSNSPCLAAGSITAPSLPATDLDGNPRILNGSVDLGCYEFTTNVVHPADTNAIFFITAPEFAAYAAAWTNGSAWTNGPNPGPKPISADYLTRAGYLMTNGGAYHNDGSARPVNWKTNAP